MQTLLFRELTPGQQAAALAQRPDDPWKDPTSGRISPKGDAARVMWYVGTDGELWPKVKATAISYGFSR